MDTVLTVPAAAETDPIVVDVRVLVGSNV